VGVIVRFVGVGVGVGQQTISRIRRLNLNLIAFIVPETSKYGKTDMDSLTRLLILYMVGNASFCLFNESSIPSYSTSNAYNN